jgi:hypothetical protein
LLGALVKGENMKDIIVETTRSLNLLEFLAEHGFEVQDLGDEVFRVAKEDELPVFVSHQDGSLYFEVDIGSLTDITGVVGCECGPQIAPLLLTLLDINTDILPVSFAINSSDPTDPHLVLVESRVTGDLSEHEVLSVFDALALAADKAEMLLTELPQPGKCC